MSASADQVTAVAAPELSRVAGAVTNWDAVPLVVVGVPAVARILNRSTRAIKRDLADGRMSPAPLKRREGPRAPWEWSKRNLRRYAEPERGRS